MLHGVVLCRTLLRCVERRCTVSSRAAVSNSRAMSNVVLCDVGTLGEDGKPIIVLPPKTVDIVRLEPSAMEADFYRALHERCVMALVVC